MRATSRPPVSRLPNPLAIARPCTDFDLAQTAATKSQMSEARLPIPYRDSCAHLLIPLNRCRYEEYYLPWKCEVRYPFSKSPRETAHDTLTTLFLCLTQPTNTADKSGNDSFWSDTNIQNLPADMSLPPNRTNATPTKSASTKSSSCASQRWTNSGLPRAVPGQTKSSCLEDRRRAIGSVRRPSEREKKKKMMREDVPTRERVHIPLPALSALLFWAWAVELRINQNTSKTTTTLFSPPEEHHCN